MIQFVFFSSAGAQEKMGTLQRAIGIPMEDEVLYPRGGGTLLKKENNLKIPLTQQIPGRAQEEDLGEGDEEILQRAIAMSLEDEDLHDEAGGTSLKEKTM